MSVARVVQPPAVAKRAIIDQDENNPFIFNKF